MVATPCHTFFTKLLARSIVQYMVTCINILSSKNGILNDLRLSAVILGYPNPDYNKIRITLGALHDNFTMFSGFGSCRELARRKTQPGTYKAREHNRHTV